MFLQTQHIRFLKRGTESSEKAELGEGRHNPASSSAERAFSGEGYAAQMRRMQALPVFQKTGERRARCATEGSHAPGQEARAGHGQEVRVAGCAL